MAAGLLTLGYVAYDIAGTAAFQATEQRRFEQTAAVVPETALAPVEGAAVAEMRIPRLALTVIVLEGDSAAVLRRAVGHLAATALPGHAGNVVLAGHRDTFFRPLKQVRRGDVIELRTGHGDFSYVVESTTVVPATEMSVLEPTGGHTLTLITCFPFAYVGGAPDRFIVRAREAPMLRD
jgi:sortase A